MNISAHSSANMAAMAAASASREPQPPTPPTGFESPGDAADGGWLGQVPPPDPEPSCVCPPAPSSEPDFANPWLAPDPWSSNPVLPGTDPTLFG